MLEILITYIISQKYNYGQADTFIQKEKRG